MKSVADDCFSRHRRSCRAAGLRDVSGPLLRVPGPFTPGRKILSAEKNESERKRESERGLPSVHGEISVEHLFAHLFPLDSAGKFQVCELVSQQLRLHEPLRADGAVSKIGLHTR